MHEPRIIKWLKKKHEKPAEQPIGREFSEKSLRAGEADRRSDELAERLEGLAGRNPELRNILDDIDFDEVERILHEHVRRSADGVEPTYDPIAQNEDIFFVPMPEDSRSRKDDVTLGHAIPQSRTISINEELLLNATRKKRRHPLYKLTEKQQRMERLYAKMQLLGTIFHEEVHLIQKNSDKIGGLQHAGDFNAVKEGVIEMIARDLRDAYMQRKGFQEFSGISGKEYKRVRRLLDTSTRALEVDLVDIIVELCAHDVPLPSESIKKSLIRGTIRGLDLAHPRVELERIVGTRNFEKLRKARAGDDTLRALVNDLGQLLDSRRREGSAIKKVYEMLGVESDWKLWIEYDEREEDFVAEHGYGPGGWDYKDDKLIYNQVKEILGNVDTGKLSDGEKESRGEILIAWYFTAMRCAIEHHKDKAAAEAFLAEAIKYDATFDPEERLPPLPIYSLMLNDKYDDAEAQISKLKFKEDREVAGRMLARFRRGAMFINA